MKLVRETHQLTQMRLKLQIKYLGIVKMAPAQGLHAKKYAEPGLAHLVQSKLKPVSVLVVASGRERLLVASQQFVRNEFQSFPKMPIFV